MSLATRCTSCGTVFRVVEDQLKVSEGWVRCGRCDAVFNAAEGLFDLERESPPAWSPTQPPADAGRSALPAVSEHDLPTQDADTIEETPAALGDITSAGTADATSTASARQSDDERFLATGAALGILPEATASPAEPVEAAPGFVVRAGRERRTQAALWGATLVLAVVLAVQAAAQFSDIAAARWPGLRPVLAAWCGVAACSLAAPRRIDEIVVDNSSLAPVIGTAALKLDLALRNRAGFAVAMPSIDLSLTDSTGQLIARRALQPADFGIAAAVLPPGAETALQTHITAGTAAVTGYAVEIFYP